MRAIYVGFMRLITLNFRLFCKPTELGWRRQARLFPGKDFKYKECRKCFTLWPHLTTPEICICGNDMKRYFNKKTMRIVDFTRVHIVRKEKELKDYQIILGRKGSESFMSLKVKCSSMKEAEIKAKAECKYMSKVDKEKYCVAKIIEIISISEKGRWRG